jgi:uncharacterized protein (DUF433 family)
LGRDYATTDGARHFPAILAPASRRPPLLSFWNLIEAHVLRALRTEHGVPVHAVRKALAVAGKLFLERYGQLVELTASGQLAMWQVLEAHLKRVEWDKWQFPVRLYPFPTVDMLQADRPIAIDPMVAFGRPIVVRRGITTAVIAERVDAGETIDVLAADYDLEPEDIKHAIVYEHAA